MISTILVELKEYFMTSFLAILHSSNLVISYIVAVYLNLTKYVDFFKAGK